MPLNVAIVGAGPGGFYTAAALIKEIPDCKVDVIDKLPTPFGLIRAGVAPDHQSSKKIAKVFERTAMEDNVRFLGHVAVGNMENGGDVSVDELRGMYDAVVIAIGAPEDRKLGIPGEDLNGVFGSAAFVGWYNANPDHESLGPDLTTGTAVVIGAGNVALDVARLIAKTQEEVSVTDMADHAVDEIGRSPLTDVYIYARRGPLQAAFTHKEVKEFGDLHNAVTLVDPAVLPPEDAELDDKGRGNSAKNVALMRDYARNKGDEKPVRIHMEFYARPVEVLGSGKVEAIKMERTEVKDDGACVGTGEFFEMPCNLVVTCIGTSSIKLDDVPYDEDKQRFINEDGKIEEGLYAAGWAKRGPTGTIATNHPDGVVVAEQIAKQQHDEARTGGTALDALLKERGVRVVSYDDWKKIEAAEEQKARDGAPRRKFVSIEDMLAVLD